MQNLRHDAALKLFAIGKAKKQHISPVTDYKLARK